MESATEWERFILLMPTKQIRIRMKWKMEKKSEEFINRMRMVPNIILF